MIVDADWPKSVGLRMRPRSVHEPEVDPVVGATAEVSPPGEHPTAARKAIATPSRWRIRYSPYGIQMFFTCVA